VGPRLGRATWLRLGLEPSIPSIFISWRSAWPKNTYIKAPTRCSQEGAAEKHETQK
jgi:hypothetical protein